MSGTKIGGQHARDTIFKRYGVEHYKRIGALGGAKGHTGGFYLDKEAARIQGAKGGRKSKRRPARKAGDE